MKNCPMCGKDAAGDAAICVCGYSFAGIATGNPSDSHQIGPDLASGHKSMLGSGVAMFMFGILCMGYAGFVFDPTVEAASSAAEFGFSERINNTGLLQKQMMIFLFGAFTTLAGSVMWAGGAIYAHLRDRGAN